jgi:tRNA/tmRNA/rRNA uracil-C5-methylase (TrmA/RlmC/RlmD family)
MRKIRTQSSIENFLMLQNSTPTQNLDSSCCPVFGQCGGCQYQGIPYSEELKIKEDYLKQLLTTSLGITAETFDPIVASPKSDHYRSRLDLKVVRSRNEEKVFGFSPAGLNRMVPTTNCAIAMEAINDFLPELRSLAFAKMTGKYRMANLVVKTGDDKRVCWGGIGRRSLQMKEEDYFWSSVNGRRIYYSLDTFFQANLSILTLLIERIWQLDILNPETIFYDLYGGVGLFGISFADKVKKVVIVEENQAATRIAEFNQKYHQLNNLEIITGRFEEHLSSILGDPTAQRCVAIIDPTRNGLSPNAVNGLSTMRKLNFLLYLSCNPEALVRDLMTFAGQQWKVIKVIPFDFFPRTKHLETLVVLQPLH